MDGRHQTVEQPIFQTKADALRYRTRQYALAVIRLCESLPKRQSAQVIGQQLLRSATSVGAHHREACRARSTAEFISKVEVALQELDETMYWLELLLDSGNATSEAVLPLMKETDELCAILTSSSKTAKSSRKA
ncbi:four helix bundle protein [bacterium]|nr:four helix bundle protein [bacterium]